MHSSDCCICVNWPSLEGSDTNGQETAWQYPEEKIHHHMDFKYNHNSWINFPEESRAIPIHPSFSILAYSWAQGHSGVCRSLTNVPLRDSTYKTWRKRREFMAEHLVRAATDFITWLRKALSVVAFTVYCKQSRFSFRLPKVITLTPQEGKSVFCRQGNSGVLQLRRVSLFPNCILGNEIRSNFRCYSYGQVSQNTTRPQSPCSSASEWDKIWPLGVHSVDVNTIICLKLSAWPITQI